MSDNARWVHPFGSRADGAFQVAITDALDGWRHTSLRVATLASGDEVSLDLGDHDVAVAQAPGGTWAPLTNGYTLGSATVKLQRDRRTASFVAAQGADALRSLASVSP